MFFNLLISLLFIVPGLLASSCSVNCPVNSGTKSCSGNYCSGSYSPIFASCDGRYCRCHKSVLYDGCSCLPHVSGCLVKKSPSTYVGLPYTDGSPESLYYGCVSTATNCEYEVHVIANHFSSNGRNNGFNIEPTPGFTYVNVNINGQSSVPLILVFTSYWPVYWRLKLSSGVVVNRILLSGFYTSKVFGYSNTSVEVVPRNILRSGYGEDDGGGHTADSLVYLSKRFGPISSFSGSYRADEWTVNINRSPACSSSMSTNGNPQSIVIRFEKERYTVHENKNVTVALLTNGPTDRNITVQYTTIDGTAQAPLDYTAINQTSIIPAGSNRFEITILIHLDTVYEERSETFRVHLSLPDEPTVCIPDATVRIFNIRPTNMPTTGRPTTNRPTTNMLTTGRPTTNRPTTNMPTTGRPTTNRPTTNMPTTGRPTTNRPTTMPTTGRPTTNRPTSNGPFSFTDRPSQMTSGISGVVGGVIGGTVMLLLALAVVIFLKILHAKSSARVMIQGNTAPNRSNNLSSTQPHPPPLPTTAAFNLPRPEPPESVVITIGKPQTCLSITQAPPPAYNLHETFTTCNEGKKLSEAPPPYLQPPPTYDTATQETD